MKLKALLTAGLISVSLLGASMASAAPHHHGNQLNFSVKKFEKRINKGVRSGELTRGETRELRRGLRKLKRAVRKAKEDHRITKREKQRLERRAKRLSRAIYEKKHNRVTRYHNRHQWGNDNSRRGGNDNHGGRRGH
jgi:hypothetical protein